MMSGVMAGYLSHIPHNVSTLKLLQVGTMSSCTSKPAIATSNVALLAN